MQKFFESLESRRLMAASFNLESLLHLNQNGSSYNYATTSLTNNSGAVTRAKGTGTVAITSHAATTTTATDTATLKHSAYSLTSAFSSGTSGLNVTNLDATAGTNTITVALSGLRVAPASMTVGKKYSDTGTFSGTITATINGTKIAGAFSGNATVVSRLTSQSSAHVKAGRFSTVKGFYEIQLHGKTKLKFNGISFNQSVDSTFEQSFDANPDVGVVKSRDSFGITAGIPFANATQRNFFETDTSELTSFDTTAPARSTT